MDKIYTEDFIASDNLIFKNIGEQDHADNLEVLIQSSSRDYDMQYDKENNSTTSMLVKESMGKFTSNKTANFLCDKARGEIFTENEIIGVIIPDMEYDEKLSQIVESLTRDFNKILYISINKPYEKLMNKFNDKKINTGKIYIIDCITKTVNKEITSDNCIYVSSPRNFDDIHTAISDILRRHEVDAALIDSPSSLLTYYDRMDVLKFIHLLMIKLLVANCKGIFPFQRESGESFRRSIEMFTDKMIKA